LSDGEDLDDLKSKRKDLLQGLEYPYGKYRRRRGAGTAGGGIITISPSAPTVPSNATVGTVVATPSVVGGTGTYVFTLTDPSGQFTILGGNIVVASTLTAGSYPVIITGNNGAGDTPQLPIIITVTPSGYVPTYELFGF